MRTGLIPGRCVIRCASKGRRSTIYAIGNMSPASFSPSRCPSFPPRSAARSIGSKIVSSIVTAPGSASWRASLLLYKYVGGLSFVFLNAAFVIVGLWIVLGLRSGIWAPGFLVAILAITFFFAILYAVSTFFAVLTRSPIVSILMTVAVWVFLFAIGLIHQFIDTRREMEKKPEAGLIEPIGDAWWAKAVDGVHFVLPRTHDLDVLTTKVISSSLLTEAERQARDINNSDTLSWGESLTVSAIFVGVLLGLSCWRFSVKDY
jgi:ABC-type transport system involved in multi-copper enzyme maturation permease subunit